MIKPRFIISPPATIHNDAVSFELPWIRPLITEHFEIAYYQPDHVYDPVRDVVLTHYAYYETASDPWFACLLTAGHRIVIDHLWDSDVDKVSVVTGNTMTLHCPNWMWYLSCREFAHHGYESYMPYRVRGSAFLMLMNNPRWHRDAVVPMLYDTIDYAVYSYNSQGRHLDNDQPSAGSFRVPWQRYMNPSWYDNTAFSVVVESYMRNTIHTSGMRTEVSEKIFKPLAYYHPFVVAGSVDTLKYLKTQGFATFDNLFDESYDSVLDDRIRLGMVCSEIDKMTREWRKRSFDPENMSVETQNRLEHNHHHFFDHSLVNTQIKKEIIDVVMEFVN